MTTSLILVLGRLCSGKGTYCQSFIDQGYYHITTSDVVKSISGKTSRRELQTTANLDQQISAELITLITHHTNVIVDGVRQSSIIDAIKTAFPHVQLIWLDVDKDTRRRRFEQRKDRKDNVSFDEAEAGDDLIGISEVETKYRPYCNTIEN